MSLTEDLTVIRNVLESERTMREWVFRDDPAKRRRKSDEIDRALQALTRVQRALEAQGLLLEQKRLF